MPGSCSPCAVQATPRDSDMDEAASPYTPQLEALAGHLNSFQVGSMLESCAAACCPAWQREQEAHA